MTHQTDRLNTALASRYRIERDLGEAGMASVYLREDLTRDRNVALKLLRPLRFSVCRVLLGPGQARQLRGARERRQSPRSNSPGRGRHASVGPRQS